MSRRLIMATLSAFAMVCALLAVNTAQAASPRVIENPTFSKDVKNWWTSGSYALTRAKVGSGYAAQITPRWSSGTKSPYIDSYKTTRVLAQGSTVRLDGKVSVSQKNRTLKFEVREYSADDKIVQRSTVSRKASGTGFYAMSASLKTKSATSKVQLAVWVEGVTGRNYLRLSSVSEKVTPAPVATPAPTPTPTPTPAPTTSPVQGPVDLGAGLLNDWNEAKVWVLNNPNDPKRAVIEDRVARHPDSMWLLDDSSWVRNLTNTVTRAKERNQTGVVTLYNIPGRWDGLSGPAGAAAEDEYKAWVDGIARITGDARVVFIVEPDALWFVDRLTPSGDAYKQRMNSLRYAAERLSALPNARVYIEAGTTSGSVTPQRMGELLKVAGASNKVGFAVNVSSFSPEPTISAYAAAIRDRLQTLGVSDPRFVVDTARNGNPTWAAPYEWCNPAGRKVGLPPGAVNSPTGRDLNLWVKGPGTSDGDCGVGKGIGGGRFMPQVAYDMAR